MFISRDSRFLCHIDYLITTEGGVNKKIVSWDRGGVTNFGATYKIFRKHLDKYKFHDFYLDIRWERWHSIDPTTGDKYFDIKKYTKHDHSSAIEANDVKFFYFKEFWEPIKADDMPRGVDFYVFDFCVHSGQGNAIKCLQEIIKVIPDGAVGPKTIMAIEHYIKTHGVVIVEGDDGEEFKIFSRKEGLKKLLIALNARRRRFLLGTLALIKAPRGMRNRLMKVLTYSHEIAGVVYEKPPKPLETNEELKVAKVQIAAGGGIAAAVGAGQGAQALVGQEVTNQVPNLIGKLESLNMVSSLISGIMNNSWLVMAIVLLGFGGYYGYVAIRKKFAED